MNFAISRTIAVAGVIGMALASLIHARDLSFDERVAAERAISRVKYAHQEGATRPFDEAVPPARSAERVRRYLRQSLALEWYWKTEITEEMLQREMDRIGSRSQMPQRLGEIYAALKNDPFLIQECLARPILVDRLTRSFHAFDDRIHGANRLEADRLRDRLIAGEIDPHEEDPRRTRVRVTRQQDSTSPSDAIALADAEFEEWRGQAPRKIREVGEVIESHRGFGIRLVLEDQPDEFVMVTYEVRKTSWEEWWHGARDQFDERDAVAVARPSGPVIATSGAAVSAVEDCMLEGSWHAGALGGVPSGRYDFGMVWTGSEMIIWGGRTYETLLDSGGRYDPVTDTWTPTSTDGAPAPRSKSAVVWTGEKMIVWGGAAFNGLFFDDGKIYDPVSDTWTSMSSVDAPTERMRASAVWTGREAIVWGGQDNFGVALQSGGRYDPATDSWSATTLDGVPTARYHHSAVWTGEQMIVWAGQNGFNWGKRYDPVTDSWATMTRTNVPEPRREHVTVWTGQEMIIFGGFGEGSGGSILNSGGRYDPTADVWTPTATTNAPEAGIYSAVAWSGQRMMVWNAGYVAQGGVYDPETDTWGSISQVNAPAWRDGVRAVWGGDRMLVWGGEIDSSVGYTYPIDGGRYDPVTDTWTPTYTPGPTQRTDHAAVWTGNEMLVWGGTSSIYLDDGARFDPVTESWTAMTTQGAPTAREKSAVVWTGEEMVVWGGRVASHFPTDTGGRYDPLSDTWTTMSDNNAPSAREDSTGLWTGEEMIVFGGSPTSAVGGRYDPKSDKWRSTRPIGAEASDRAAIAWAGDRMLVWGGVESGAVINTGSTYDPGRDRWTPMTTIGAPSPRFTASAVWMGEEMIIWGGVGGSDLSNGGRYDPLLDAWSPMSVLHGPDGTYRPTAIRVGSRMVVWGGKGDGPYEWPVYSNSGASYDPSTDSWVTMSTVEAPHPRNRNSAVDASGQMIVWGGYDGGPLGDGSQFSFAGADSDEDTFNSCEGDCDDQDSSVFPGAVQVCDGINNDCGDPGWPVVPADEIDGDGDGVWPCQADCDDGDPATFPGASEINDGTDNQCPGDDGFGLVDETSGNSGFFDPANAGEYSWPQQQGATGYEVVRSGTPDFSTDCVVFSSPIPSIDDPEVPSVGFGFYYLNRAVTPNVGSWGSDSTGAERTPAIGPF